ncbi:hypothetical protein HJC23_012881 [Cyclotella cryptica]|uniref:Methyltransferase domain-containing protein n=1 Tax=Cyclotella cryptica TaxID=29204 RepID=A0ABD3Q2W8_9STRA|eukprot:CCRYP_009468-RA/>CCRYP_009468-RA protein AED:0.17 eAED:0.17 QI:0/-1/0/1/-1/1/1/0/281
MSMSQDPSRRQASTDYNGRNHLALTAIGSSFVAILACTFPFVSMQLRSPLPYMATPRRKVEKALKFISERRRMQSQHPDNAMNKSHDGRTILTTQHSTIQSNTQPSHATIHSNTQPRFVDLGSGDGTTIFAAASLDWKSTGVELNPTLWALSSLRRIRQPPDIRQNCAFIYGDMFQSATLKRELRNSHCVMVFGVNSLMPKIADLIRMECGRGVFVMSYRFQVPLLVEERTCASDDSSTSEEKHGSKSSGVIDASLVYEEEEMRVYELHGDQLQRDLTFNA